MKPAVGKTISFAAGSLALVMVAQADVANPRERFDVILQRNPFGLRPPPPPPTNTPAVSPTPPVTIKITGVTVNATGKKAWFMIPALPPKNPNPQYLSLGEGEKQGDIEVVSINERDATARIMNAGMPLELNFKENGLAAPAAPPVMATHPGGIPPPGGLVTPGVIRPGATPAIPNYNAPGTTAVPYVTPQASAPLRALPARNVRTTPIESISQGVQQQVAQPQPEIDPAIQYIKARAAAEKARAEGISYPPIPVPPGFHQ